MTDETSAADSGRSLKIVNAPGLSRPWIPYVSYAPGYDTGMATVELCLRVEPGAVLEYVWRGSHPTREFSTGPALTLCDGKLLLRDGRTLDVPVSQWLKLKVTARLGAFDPGIGGAGQLEHGRWHLEVTLPDGRTESFEGLSHVDADFHDLRTVMFISAATGNAVFYLDEVRISAVVDENP